MRVLLLYNPVAGAGRGERTARELATALRAGGHEPALLASRTGADTAWLDEALAAGAGAGALAVVGGDGAVRLSAAAAARAGTPLYHVPTGTENLFARAFGMERGAERLLAALGRGRTVPVDVGSADGVAFLLMASIGFDAEVVHDLATRRGASISHLSYLGPLLRRFVGWRPPRLTIDVDGERIVDDRPGSVVVANAEEYALRLNPARGASMTDGRLDAVFLPAASRWRVPGLLLACRRGRLARVRGCVRRAGALVEIRCRPPVRWQLDGDPSPEPAPVADLRLAVAPDNLRVLLP